MNGDFLDERLLSFDDTPTTKREQHQNSNNMLNYSEKIKINSYDGYFDSFNCMCLFSFENIFDLGKGCCCKSLNYNTYQNNILNNFSYYTPRKNTFITGSTNSTQSENNK